jgi:hypothetical protein
MRVIRVLLVLLAGTALGMLPPASRAQVLVSVTVAPPPLPVYVQPVIPGPDYMWVPGYWAWDLDDYYWVPGTWVLAPAPGLLWTPGYWAWSDGVYIWRAGYWGPRVGFYGGINYGCGYTGVGFQGGYWSGGVFRYNTAVVNVGTVRITNVYNKTVINNTSVTNVSFNGGRGGVLAQPNAQELAASNDKHLAATSLQTQHQQAAISSHELRASVNHGHPAIAATAAAAHLAGAGIVAAKGYNAMAKQGGVARVVPGPGGPKPPGQLNAARMVGQPGPGGPRPPAQFNAVRKVGQPFPGGPRPPSQFNAARMMGQPGPKGPPPHQYNRPDH